MRKPSIHLTDGELDLLAKINFQTRDHEAIRSSLEPMRLLTDSLLDRNAIPNARLQYFSDPEYNPSGRGKSRLQAFERNGTSADEVASHPNFLKYLEYFIFGPALPDTITNDFIQSVIEDEHISLRDIQDYAPKARAFVRSSGISSHVAAEEFFKLAIENGASPSTAASLRASVMSVRS